MIKMVGEAGQVYWMFCKVTALFRELKASLASTNKNPSEASSVKILKLLMEWIAASTPEI